MESSTAPGTRIQVGLRGWDKQESSGGLVEAGNLVPQRAPVPVGQHNQTNLPSAAGNAPSIGEKRLVPRRFSRTWMRRVPAAGALARRLGIDARQFLNTVHGSPLELPYADAKAEAVITGDYTVNFPLRHASKDTQLVLDAAGNGGMNGVRAALTHLEQAARRGVEPADMAALYQGID